MSDRQCALSKFRFPENEEEKHRNRFPRLVRSPDMTSKLGDSKKIGEIIRSIQVGMLTTVQANGELRSRPMLCADCDFDSLWFLVKESKPYAAGNTPRDPNSSDPRRTDAGARAHRAIAAAVETSRTDSAQYPRTGQSTRPQRLRSKVD